MKKLFYVLAVATVATLTSCGGGETKEEAKPADTTTVAPSTETPAAADTTTAKADTAAVAK